MATQTPRFLALDIGSSTIKLGEFVRSSTGGLRLLNFNYSELATNLAKEEDRGPHIAAAIQDLLRQKKIRPAPTVVSVSGQQVFTRFTKLPPVTPDKIAEIIRYEAQQNVPIPIEELVWDYQLASAPGASEVEVALVAIKANLVEELVACVEQAKLQVDIVDVSPMALYNCVRYNYGDPQGCVVLADVGGRTTNLVFVEQNRLYSRSFPIGGNAFTQALAQEFQITLPEAEQMKKKRGFVGLGAYAEPESEELARISQVLRSTMNRLEGELRRTINIYRSQQGGSAPTTLLLSGATSVMPYADQYFREKYPNVTVDFFNPFRNIEIAEGVPREELAKCAPFFGEVVGLGLRKVAKCHMEVNLLPPRISTRRKTAARTPWLVAAAIVVPFTLGLWYTHTSQLAKSLEKANEEFTTQEQENKARSATIDKAVSDALASETNIKKIDETLDVNDWWAKLLQDINGRLPEYVWISRFETTLSQSPGRGGSFFEVGGRGIATGATTADQGKDVYILEGTGIANTVETKTKEHGPGTVMEEFRKRLEDSPYVDPLQTKILSQPEPKEGEYTYTFQLQIKLKMPKFLL